MQGAADLPQPPHAPSNQTVSELPLPLLEFASPAWLDLFEQVVADLVAADGASVADQRLSICQEVRDPPGHLARNTPDGIAWTVSFAEGRGSVVRGQVAEASYTMQEDYAGNLPRAKTAASLSPETWSPQMAAIAQARREGVASGRILERGDLSRASPAMMTMLVELHNRMAIRTA
jgi:hypothetical protein